MLRHQHEVLGRKKVRRSEGEVQDHREERDEVRSRIRFGASDPAMALARRDGAAVLIEEIPFAVPVRPDRAQLKTRRQSLLRWPRPCRTERSSGRYS